jgi:hypothetical protein
MLLGRRDSFCIAIGVAIDGHCRCSPSNATRHGEWLSRRIRRKGVRYRPILNACVMRVYSQPALAERCMV